MHPRRDNGVNRPLFTEPATRIAVHPNQGRAVPDEINDHPERPSVNGGETRRATLNRGRTRFSVLIRSIFPARTALKRRVLPRLRNYESKPITTLQDLPVAFRSRHILRS